MQNEIDLNCYSYSIYENEALIYGLYRKHIKTFQEVLETWDGFQDYVPKIELFMNEIGHIGRKAHSANKKGNGYNVLNHGDFHSRNILVKLNSQKKLQQFYFVRAFIKSFFV